MQNYYDNSKTKPAPIEELISLWKFRDLIKQLIRRDIVTRYKRSVLGILWTMLNPLGTMIILSIVFSRLFNMRGIYPAYIITNLIAWNFFSQSTQFAINSTLWGSDLLKKIYMPRTAFVIATIGTSTANLLFSLVPLVIIYIVTNVKFQPSIFLLPFSLIILGSFALGLSLLLSTIVVFFPDVAEFYPVLLTAWMYLTPIIYPEELLLDIANGWVLKLNPLYHIIKLFREILYGGVNPSISEWGIAIIISFITLTLGWIVFTNKSKSFGYHV
jgi:ABC-2 type transport system permease protein